MNQPLVYIIVVNYNGGSFLKNCLASIARLKTRNLRLHTVVIDNASNDDSFGQAKKLYPQNTYIKNQSNLGFCRANNIGIQKAMTDGAGYIWLVNNDAVLVQDALCLTQAFADAGVGIAGSKILFAKGREFHAERYQKTDLGKVIWYAGGIIDWNNMYGFHRGVDEVDRGQYDKPEDTDFVSGCSMMIKPELIRKAGVFDPKYFLYLEDLDLCIRAKRAGFRLAYYPQSVVFHENASSSGGPGSQTHEYYMSRNRLWLGFKYAPLRTKIALTREALKYLIGGNSVRRQAVIDVIRRHYGRK